MKFRFLKSYYKFAFIILFISTMIYPLQSQDYPLSDRINTSEGVVEMYFIGHGSLMFSLHNLVIHIDPVRSSGSYEKLPKADLILVTHEHYDHLDTDLIADLRKSETVMFANAPSAAKISWAKPVRAGEINSVNKITIEAIPAYNIVHMRSPGEPFHPKDKGLGFIITIGDKRIYVAGDTENTPEMKALKDIDVAFLPMNLPYTMTPEMVANAAMAFKPGILYPYHYGDTDPEKIVNLLRDTNIEVRIRNLK